MKTAIQIAKVGNTRYHWVSAFVKTKIVRLLILFLFLSTDVMHAQAFNWAGAHGGSSNDEGRSIVVDASGNVYTTGFFRNTSDFDPGPGTNTLTSVGVDDVYVMKQDATGSLVWVQGIGGSGSDIGYGIALDATGAVIVTGRFASTVDFDPGSGVTSLTSSGLGDIFILKLNSTGGFVWVRQIGNTGDDVARSVVVDQSNNIYTTGYFAGTVDFNPGAGVDNLICPGSPQNAFISKLDATGNYLFARRLGGASGTYGLDIALDATGNIFTTGYFIGTADFDPGTLTNNSTSAGQQDIYISKLNSSGNYLWVGCAGGTFADISYSIAVAADGGVIATGYFSGTADFNPSTGTYNRTSFGGEDIFVLKLTASGNFSWAGAMGSNSQDMGLSVAVDAAGDIHIGGFFGNLADFDPSSMGTYSVNCNGTEDLFICKLTSWGAFTSCFGIGSTAASRCYDITTRSCKIYSTGYFQGASVDFDPGSGTNNLSAVGSDIYVNQMSIIRSSTQTTTVCGSSYTWPTNGITYTTSGVYAAYLTTAGGCDSIRTLTLTFGTSPTVSSTASNATICQGGSTTITASGATSYSWLPGPMFGTTITVAPTTTTTYTVTGTGTNGCTATSTITITVNSIPTVTTTASSTTICAGSSTSLSASGASTYTWMPGSLSGSTVSVSPTSTTTYTVTGTAVNGCTTTATRTITVNATPTVTSTASVSTICAGSTVALTATGASTYLWMPGSLSGTSVSVTPTATTTYTVTGTASNGCTNTSTITITVDPLPSVAVTASSSSICVGNSTTLTATGANTYAWMPGSLSGSIVTVTPASTTTYTVTGTSLSGCVNTQTIVITVGSAPIVTASTSTPNICVGSSATLVASGTTTYTWMPGSLSGSSVTVAPTVNTTYTVTGVNGPGCSNTAIISVVVNPLPFVAATASASTICEGDASTLTASGAITYTWMPGSLSGSPVSVTPVSSTTYTLTGTDANGCTNTSTTSVTVNAAPLVASTAANSTICAGNSTTVNATGATTYSWMPGALAGSSVTVAPGLTTTYTVIGTGANGCTNTSTTTITVNPVPTNTITVSNSTICSGESTSLTASGSATTHTWIPGPLTGNSVTVNPVTTTTYTLTATDVNGCWIIDSTTIVVNATPSITTSASNSSVCIGNSATLTANGASTYNWMPGALSGSTVSVTPTVTTTYTVTGTATNGCSNSQTITISAGTSPTVTVSSSGSVICEGDTTTLTANGTATYSWMPGSMNGSSVTVMPTATTTYTVIGDNGPGCSDTATYTITVNPLPAVSMILMQDTFCITDGPIPLSGGSPVGGIYSGPGVAANMIDPSSLTLGTFVLVYTFTNANGCSDIATQLVVVDNCNGVENAVAEPELSAIPNPNNGEFVLTFSSDIVDDYVLEIHDALGQFVYTENINGFSGQYRREISLTDFAAGIYTVQLKNSVGQTTVRVITQ